MKRIIFILILVILATGCTAKEQTYVSVDNPQSYVTFNSDKTGFFHNAGNDAFKGEYEETDTEFTFFRQNDEPILFEKINENQIGMKLREGGTYIFEKKLK